MQLTELYLSKPHKLYEIRYDCHAPLLAADDVPRAVAVAGGGAVAHMDWPAAAGLQMSVQGFPRPSISLAGA